MHAQRCPVAKLRAASQQQQNQAAGRGANSRVSAAAEAKKKQDKNRRGLAAKTPERPSFFQNVHGESAPLLPPHPQMYSDETWALTHARPPPHPDYRKEAPRPKPLTRLMHCKDSTHTKAQSPTLRLHYKETALAKSLAHPAYLKEDTHDTKRKDTVDRSLIINENCAVHGHNTPLRYSLPKSLSCPSSRQTADVERLKNWRRNSLTLTPSSPNPFASATRLHSSTTATTATPGAKEQRRRPLSQGHELPSLPHGQRMVVRQHVSSSRALSPPSTTTSRSNSQPKNTTQSEDTHGRRSQFRRAWSLFAMGCDENQKKTQPQSILRQPTRHVYRRGISGLPVECTSMDVGVVF
uniref:Uncharacterized protein n=1 Tax=Scylla olivacea TaxID=85551 RepID=A0A0P4WYS4_SCYOL